MDYLPKPPAPLDVDGPPTPAPSDTHRLRSRQLGVARAATYGVRDSGASIGLVGVGRRALSLVARRLHVHRRLLGLPARRVAAFSLRRSYIRRWCTRFRPTSIRRPSSFARSVCMALLRAAALVATTSAITSLRVTPALALLRGAGTSASRSSDDRRLARSAVQLLPVWLSPRPVLARRHRDSVRRPLSRRLPAAADDAGAAEHGDQQHHEQHDDRQQDDKSEQRDDVVVAQ